MISLGGAPPFYHLWWTIMPFVKKTRAPGMVFFVVALCTAMFAAFGVTRLEQGEGSSHVRAWLIAAGAVALLGLVGVFGNLATALAPPERAAAAAAHSAAIRMSAIIGAIARAGTALIAMGRLRGGERIPAQAFALALPLLVGADLWRDGRRFWVHDPPSELSTRGPIVTLRSEPKPFVSEFPTVSNNSMAITFAVLGYQGQELRYSYELLGGRNKGICCSIRWGAVAARFVLLPVARAARLPLVLARSHRGRDPPSY